jgi:hypothetical protein
MHHSISSLPLLETSLADAIPLIEAADALPPSTRTQWVCSLRQIAKALDRPLALVPARWTALRLPVSRLHHAPLGVTAKTLANHKANLKAALRWLRRRGWPARAGSAPDARMGRPCAMPSPTRACGRALWLPALCLGSGGLALKAVD